ncbi:TonB-dependent receptor [Psychrosphaera aquimarina]|uniref:TonB-dependent receptor n=1 Tax=Psychrosphaera aquimarina TaxID=2044854 RepID=A0ABU3QX78_9GAMM|nr:TonB-dependent receptor [Psychrosphaera aquimarina]MDU0112015.1 TonB-dependent receptor [Psychrosphaera aquimarina]
MKVFNQSYLAITICTALSINNVALAADETSTDKQKIEKITVTGSQIKGVDLEGMQPLIILDAEAIRKSGASSVSELMKQLGQTRGGEGSFSTSESGATSTSTPAGQAAASLRGLGPSSTLTLINGRRIAASSFASGTQNFVDINTIPLAAIEKIEVLATGASAIYGADAVAGVINYILKKDYKGAELNTSYGNSFNASDNGKVNINFVVGTEIGGGNLTAFVDYFDRSAFSAQDRAFTKDPLLESAYSYLPKNTPNIYYYSARTGNEIGNPNCKTDFVTTEYGEEICAYYRNEDDMLNSELSSSSAGFVFTKDIGDITWNTDFFYSHSNSVAISSPAPINQLDDSDGPWVDETALNAFSDEVRDDLLDQMYIDPFDTIAGRELWGFQFDARFASPRTVEVTTDAIRFVSELSGSLGEWDWDSAVTLSKSESEQQAIAGIYNRYKYHAALAGELCSSGEIANYDGTSGNLACNSGELLAMYNPFLEGNTANNAILEQTQEVPTRDGESTVYGWDARISGELFELNDEFVSAAFGMDVRKESITDTPSLNSQARAENGYLVDVFGFGSSLSEAERLQWGAFSEFYVPLNDQLELQLAGRYDNYDDFGDSFNPKVGISYRPLEELILRASWSTSFRAPSLTQAGVKLRTTTATYDCGANQSVADLYCEGFGDQRSPNVLELGNANLQAEESEALSLGFAFSPTVDTTLTVDYWSFEHEKLVDTDMTRVLSDAISDASLRHCGLVPNGQVGISYEEDLCLVTDSSGLTIEDSGANLGEILNEWVAFDSPRYAELPLYRDHIIQLENTGKQTVSGIDLAFVHYISLTDGEISLNIDATHYIEFDRNKAGSEEIEQLIGTWRYPQDIASAKVAWSTGAFYSSVTLNYTSSYSDDTDGLNGRQIAELSDLGLINEENQRDVEAWTTVRLNLGYDFENMNVNLTINNMFDENPPVAYGSSRGFDSINHDALGANYRASLTYFF